ELWWGWEDRGGRVWWGDGGSTSKHLLEIEVVGSKRRVWAAESKQECRRWVSAIKAAMTERPVNPDETILGEDQLPIIPQDSCHRHHMESYLSARGFLRNATSTEDYLSALKGLMAEVGRGTGGGLQEGGEKDSSMGVPVKWVKQQLPGSERVYQASGRGRGKSELAQLWKDMKRDTVSINGRVMTGERGPEGIIGALTRCILAQAGRLSASDSLSKLSEAQSLLAARDVLLACDRTTSGGDTYLVVDNLCRNPPLVVLVPASQEAEPLDITVTLHPRAAQVQTQGHKQSPSRHYRHTIDGGTKGPQANSPPSPGELPEPPSPSSLGSGSAAASPSFGHRSSGVQRSPPSARNSEGGFTSPGGGGDGDTKAQHQPARKGGGWNGVQTGGGVKRRGRLKIPGSGRVTLTRTGSAVGGRVAPTTLPVPPDMRQAASWDGGTQSLAATAPAGLGRPWAEDEGEAVASPTGQRKPGLVSSKIYGADGGEGSGATGGGIFASLARRRSVDQAAGYSGSNVGLNSKRSVPSAMSAIGQGDSGGKGHKEGGVRGGLSSAPAAALASYKMFFGDTDDGGEESESSNDEEDGPLFRTSYIQVTCTARTSYKLFSSDPQDEERDVYAVVTGLFEQSFTISREFPAGSGSRASSGMGNATRTEGSVAFLTFHDPAIKRQSLDKGAAGDIKAALETERAKMGVEEARDPTSNATEGGTIGYNPFDDESDDESGGGGDGDTLGASGLDARTLLPPDFCNGSVSGEEVEGEGRGEVLVSDVTSAATADNSRNPNNDRPLDDGRKHATVVNMPSQHESRSSEPVGGDLFEEGPEEREERRRKGYGFVPCEEDATTAADGEVVNMTATAALTPDSGGPVTFSPGSASPRSGVCSIETPPSLAASSPSPANSSSVERTVSRVTGLLRRFSSRDIVDPDPAETLRLEPLEIDSDDYGA
ncbi:unnamed protein product, partial [Ectocarpus sp. 6 AP-2014]